MLACDYYQPSRTGRLLAGPCCVTRPLFTPLTVLTGRLSWACFSGTKVALVFWSDLAGLRWLYNSTCQARFSTRLGSLLSQCRLDRATTLQPALSLWKAWPLLRITFQPPRHPAGSFTRSSPAHMWPSSHPGRQQGLRCPPDSDSSFISFSLLLNVPWGVSCALEEYHKDVKRFWRTKVVAPNSLGLILAVDSAWHRATAYTWDFFVAYHVILHIYNIYIYKNF